jgi:hypothetical protein
MRGDTRRDGKHLEIVFGRGMRIGSFLSSVRSTQTAQFSSFHFISCRDRASFVVGAWGRWVEMCGFSDGGV